MVFIVAMLMQIHSGGYNVALGIIPPHTSWDLGTRQNLTGGISVLKKSKRTNDNSGV